MQVLESCCQVPLSPAPLASLWGKKCLGHHYSGSLMFSWPMPLIGLPQFKEGQPGQNFSAFGWKYGADRWLTQMRSHSLGKKPAGISESWICTGILASAAPSHLAVGWFWWKVSASMDYCFPAKFDFIRRQLTSSFPNKHHQIIWCYQQKDENWQKFNLKCRNN